MENIKLILQERLEELELTAKHGQVPGEVDRFDLEQLIGRIKEIKYFLMLLE